MHMSADALPLPLTTDVPGHLMERLTGSIVETVNAWAGCYQQITQWESEHLLDEAPIPAALEAHKTTVQRMILLGGILSWATRDPNFPDRKAAEIVQATQACLLDKLALWHGNTMTKEESDRLLAEVFGES